jgi:hypothetical protein
MRFQELIYETPGNKKGIIFSKEPKGSYFLAIFRLFKRR